MGLRGGGEFCLEKEIACAKSGGIATGCLLGCIWGRWVLRAAVGQVLKGWGRMLKSLGGQWGAVEGSQVIEGPGQICVWKGH